MSSEATRVDYEAVAARYRSGRALSEAACEQWRQVVEPHLPRGGPGRVVDVGAGTGVFLPMWASLGANEVVAVEPSAAMRREASQTRLPAGTAIIGGVGEHLPLRGHSIGVVWMSAVFHQLTDRDQAISEVARVLGSGGAWLVRGFFSDRSRVGWLDWFPGADRAKATFPSVAETVDQAERRGFALVGAEEVASEGTATLAEAANWIRAMRSADTLLCALSDAEVAAGLAAMELDPEAVCPPNLLTLLAFRGP